MWIEFGNINLGTGSLCAVVKIAMTNGVCHSTAAFTILAYELRTEISWTGEQHTDSYTMILYKQNAQKNTFKRDSSRIVD